MRVRAQAGALIQTSVPRTELRVLLYVCACPRAAMLACARSCVFIRALHYFVIGETPARTNAHCQRTVNKEELGFVYF